MYKPLQATWMFAVAVMSASIGGQSVLAGPDWLTPTMPVADEISVSDHVPAVYEPTTDASGQPVRQTSYTRHHLDGCGESAGCGVAAGSCVTGTMQPAAYFLTGQVGGSYFNVPGDSSLGATWGVQGGVPIAGSRYLALTGFNANHLERGDQAVLTLGIAGLPNVWSCNPADRLTGSILFDQFWDWRFNDDVHLSLMRLQAGYAFSRSLEVGVSYWEPIGSGEDGLTLGGVNFGSLRPTQAVGGYLRRDFGIGSVSARAQYRSRFDTVALGATLERNLGSRFGLLASADYEDRGTWASFAGVTVRVGPDMSRKRVAAAPRPSAPAELVACTDWSDGPQDIESVLRGDSEPIIRGQDGGFNPMYFLLALALDASSQKSAPRYSYQIVGYDDNGNAIIEEVEDPKFDFSLHAGSIYQSSGSGAMSGMMGSPGGGEGSPGDS